MKRQSTGKEDPVYKMGKKRMKNEWTEQDLRQFVESSRPVFQDVSLTQVDEDADRCWQDDGLMVDYELRGGQVDCVLRRCVVADGKVWQLQMTAPLAGNDLPEDRMTPREREMCRDDMNHDFVTGVFNRRYYETEFCTKLDEWTDCHRCAALALAANTDYNAIGVLIICALYLTRANRKRQCLAGAALFLFELTASLAFVLVWFYNGQRGACSPLQKKAFYWFYPVHLLVLAGITNLLL